MPDYFNELRLWRVREASHRGIRQGELVSDSGVLALRERVPQSVWGVYECVGESAFRTHGATLLSMARKFGSNGEWAKLPPHEVEAISETEVMQLKALLKNIHLMQNIKRNGISDRDIQKVLRIPLGAVTLLKHPERIGCHAGPAAALERKGSVERSIGSSTRRESTHSGQSTARTRTQSCASLESLSLSVSDVSSLDGDP